MNAAQLLNHFDRISDAPDAVPRLRRFILDLVVRGKLVVQDPNDEPASKLLCGHQLFPKPEDEPWDLPLGWAWSSYELIGETIGGGTPSKGNSEFWSGSIPWVSPKDMKVDFIRDAQDHISQLALENSAARLIPPGSLLMVVRGMILAHSFPTAISVVPVAINQDMKAVVPFRPNLTKILLLISKGMQSEVMRLVSHSTHGTCKLLTNDLFSLPLPIPPLREQHRIVAKVEELMALCDRLEAAQAERERRRDRLAVASLRCLNEPTEAPDFRKHANFHLRHLARFTTHPEQIPALRQMIRNLAVRGRLVRTSDWPAKPESLGEYATLQNGYAFKSESFVRKGIRLLRNANVSHGFIRWDDLVCLPKDRAQEFERFQLNEGDVVLSLDRPFIVTGTKVAQIRLQDLPCLLLQRVGRFQLQPNGLTADYLFLWLHSPHFTEQIDPGRSNGVPHVSSKQVEAAEVFVPLIAEQHRIVAKVEELMALCDRLEAQLASAQTESRRLLEAVLHEALVPAV
jgi:type I restriction enzyme S subunit